jgi:hypothetical protein
LAAAFLAGAFLAAAFFAGAFLAGAFLAAAFLAGAFLAAAFFTGAFLAGAFLAAGFLAGAFLAAGFLAGALAAFTFDAVDFLLVLVAMLIPLDFELSGYEATESKTRGSFAMKTLVRKNNLCNRIMQFFEIGKIRFNFK